MECILFNAIIECILFNANIECILFNANVTICNFMFNEQLFYISPVNTGLIYYNRSHALQDRDL